MDDLLQWQNAALQKNLDAGYGVCPHCHTLHREANCPNCACPKPVEVANLSGSALDNYVTIDMAQVNNRLNALLLARRKYDCPYCGVSYSGSTNCPKCGATRSRVVSN